MKKKLFLWQKKNNLGIDKRYGGLQLLMVVSVIYQLRQLQCCTFIIQHSLWTRYVAFTISMIKLLNMAISFFFFWNHFGVHIFTTAGMWSINQSINQSISQSSVYSFYAFFYIVVLCGNILLFSASKSYILRARIQTPTVPWQLATNDGWLATYSR